MLVPGLYEHVMNDWITQQLQRLEQDHFLGVKGKIDAAESSDILARYLGGILRAGLARVSGQDGEALERRIYVCNRLITLLAREMGDETLLEYCIEPQGQTLLSVLEPRQVAFVQATKTPHASQRPSTSLAQSSLFTGALHEPSMVSELKKEILTSDRIDLLVSFIKWSGLRQLMDELRMFTEHGQLRLVTTSYMGATDIKAIDELRLLPHTAIRVSYDTTNTRLHAKAYIFHRDTGLSTAYIGSSNLSHAALSTGLEWNVKVTRRDLPDTFTKIEGTFDSYWNDHAFSIYEDAQRPQLVKALRAERSSSQSLSPYAFDINPYPFQVEILEQLDAERVVHGRFRNLVVAATGTGKTVISAFDYQRFCRSRASDSRRLLFIAHREEILEQSLACFRAVLRDPNFGSLYVGKHAPDNGFDHLFVSIQMLNARDLCTLLTPDAYDFIVVDEFHHAAATSYQKLLAHFRPTVLLGLTATPERLDGEDVTSYFDHKIAAEIRLPEAIERGLLAPFHYFGVSDEADLQHLTWRRGGYDRAELSSLYTGNRQRADLVLRSVRRYVTDLHKVIGLGFCVSIEHAEFMAQWMNAHEVPAKAVHANSSGEDRVQARRQLTSGDLRFLFVVDLYNEGVDIPEINTVLFLRPTESLTVFLQQLGRGLRTHKTKECLTVLDFIGHSHRKYRFEEKFAALLSSTHRRSMQAEIVEGFAHVPRGSFIQLEKQAQSYVLSNIRQAIGTRRALVSRLQTLAEDLGYTPSLGEIAQHSHLTMREIYQGTPVRSFTQLCVDAGLSQRDASSSDTEQEKQIVKSLPRIAAVNSRHLITCWIECLSPGGQMRLRVTSEGRDFQMQLMLHYTVWQKPLSACGFASLEESLAAIRKHVKLCAEIRDILKYNNEHLHFIDEPVDLGFACALDLHCDYSRDQILCALDVYSVERMPAMREGVKHLPAKKVDILFITLNKSEKEYSPSTMYQDYAINDELFHWQSQSTTPAESATGQRYVHHTASGDRILLFVREAKADGSGALPYTYLGTASYVQHTGSRPMSITWRLHKPLPARLLRKANQLAVV